MRTIAFAASLALTLATGSAFAQDTPTREDMSKRQNTVNTQTDQSGQSAQGGAPAGTSGSGRTLMQEREQGMSPQGASDGKGTGKMKQ
jgi:hypothetical protein